MSLICVLASLLFFQQIHKLELQLKLDEAIKEQVGYRGNPAQWKSELKTLLDAKKDGGPTHFQTSLAHMLYLDVAGLQRRVVNLQKKQRLKQRWGECRNRALKCTVHTVCFTSNLPLTCHTSCQQCRQWKEESKPEPKSGPSNQHRDKEAHP